MSLSRTSLSKKVAIVGVDESDQIGLTSFAAFPPRGFDAEDPAAVWEALGTDRFDGVEEAQEFVLGSGPFALGPGEVQRFSVALFLSANVVDQARNEGVVRPWSSATTCSTSTPIRPGWGRAVHRSSQWSRAHTSATSTRENEECR